MIVSIRICDAAVDMSYLRGQEQHSVRMAIYHLHKKGQYGRHQRRGSLSTLHLVAEIPNRLPLVRSCHPRLVQ